VKDDDPLKKAISEQETYGYILRSIKVLLYSKDIMRPAASWIMSRRDASIPAKALQFFLSFLFTCSRTDKQLIDFGKALALVYNYIILADFDPRYRPLPADGDTYIALTCHLSFLNRFTKPDMI